MYLINLYCSKSRAYFHCWKLYVYAYVPGNGKELGLSNSVDNKFEQEHTYNTVLCTYYSVYDKNPGRTQVVFTVFY